MEKEILINRQIIDNSTHDIHSKYTIIKQDARIIDTEANYVLVIPDTHLKPWIFERADEIIQEYAMKDVPLQVVQLGDNLDDFYSTEQDYRSHYAMMIWFKTIHPNTIWLYGNHEVSYLIDRPVTGNYISGKEYAKKYQEDFNPKIAHIIDNVIFTHAGISEDFINRFFDLRKQKDNPQELVNLINNKSLLECWNDDSPLWCRPQFGEYLMYDFRQVVGHTPLEKVKDCDNVITTDVFSTNWGKKYGEEKFVIIDTKTGEWQYA